MLAFILEIGEKSHGGNVERVRDWTTFGKVASFIDKVVAELVKLLD
jgi:hypothetical protein